MLLSDHSPLSLCGYYVSKIRGEKGCYTISKLNIMHSKKKMCVLVAWFPLTSIRGASLVFVHAHVTDLHHAPRSLDTIRHNVIDTKLVDFSVGCSILATEMRQWGKCQQCQTQKSQ